MKQEIPAGCQEIPGYILDVFDGSARITQDGRVTDKWQERGIWPTPEAAAEMMQQLTPFLPAKRKCTYCRGKYERIQRCILCFGIYGSWAWIPKRQPRQPKTL